MEPWRWYHCDSVFWKLDFVARLVKMSFPVDNILIKKFFFCIFKNQAFLFWNERNQERLQKMTRQGWLSVHVWEEEVEKRARFYVIKNIDRLRCLTLSVVKPKTKVITTANQSRGNCHKKPMSIQRVQARENAYDQVAIHSSSTSDWWGEWHKPFRANEIMNNKKIERSRIDFALQSYYLKGVVAWSG